jgi:hypothetical protein
MQGSRAATVALTSTTVLALQGQQAKVRLCLPYNVRINVILNDPREFLFKGRSDLDQN